MMYKNIFLFFLVTLLIFPTVLGVGIGEYTKQKEFLVEPGKDVKYEFYVFDSPRVNANIEGDFTPYVTLSDPNPGGGPRNVDVTIKIPDNATPGRHTIYLTATEAPPSTGTVGGIASVRTGVTAIVLYPGKYPVFNGMNIDDVNVNETAQITVSLTNYGREAIIQANGTITIYDSENKTVAVVQTGNAPYWPYETRDLKASLDTAAFNLAPGIYKAAVNISYDGESLNSTPQQTQFIVGQLKVNVIDSSKVAYPNATNKYQLSIESDWAGTLSDVYAIIKTPNGKTLKTPSIDLRIPAPGQKSDAVLETYWETTGMNLGDYNMDVTLYYKDQTNTVSVPVKIIEGTAPVIEKPNGIFSSGNLTLFIGIIVIAAIAIYFYVKLGKNSTGRIPSGTNESVEDNDIRPPSL